MKFVPTELPGLVVVEPTVHGDDRGMFMETWHRRRFAEAGLEAEFVQDNHSRSRKGALRGLHYQHPRGQVKLCRVIAGEVFDVCVDVRRGSPTFGKVSCTTLSAENHRMLWIPAGFAHGFYVLGENTEFVYKCSDFYAPETERGILWNDPALAIPWPAGTPVLSPKDAAHPRLADVPPEHLPPFVP